MACDRLQGFFFSRPVPAACIPALLSQRWTLDDAMPPKVALALVGAR
jgi:hypothetical protein